MVRDFHQRGTVSCKGWYRILNRIIDPDVHKVKILLALNILLQVHSEEVKPFTNDSHLTCRTLSYYHFLVL